MHTDLIERCTTLEQEKDHLEEENGRLATRVAEVEAKLHWFEEQHRLSLRRQFGASSEKSDPDQHRLFDEAEALAEAAVVEPTLEEITYKRRKSKGLRDEQLKDLPEEVTEYTLPDDQLICSCCSGPLHKMGEDIRRELTIVPAQVSVRKHVRHVYSCRHCQRHEIETPVAAAPMPAPPFPGSLASASSVAYIMTQKFVEAMPLYRQEQSLARAGVELSRQTLANWMLKGADHLGVLYDRLKAELIAGDLIHADETTLQVLHEKDREAQTNSYMWLYRSGSAAPAIALYEYTTTRAAMNPRLFLKDFHGYLQVDGYAGYDAVENVILVGCWAHARRRFNDALTALSADAHSKASAASEGLAFCNRLFAIERELKEAEPEQRRLVRLTRSAHVLAEFKEWLDQKAVSVLPRSATGAAVTYCLRQWTKLSAFLLDGRIEIDNNRSERSIKPFVIGRKNWLFANTPRGARASATIYSIVETAKENGLDPFLYLSYLFEQLASIDTQDAGAVGRLLPYSADLPMSLRVPEKAKRAPPDP